MTPTQQYIVFAVLPLVLLIPMWLLANSFRKLAARNPSDTWTTISAGLCTASVSIITLGLVGWFFIATMSILTK